MNNRDIFSRCVDKAIEWFNKNFKEILKSENTVFLGIDFWGSCLAAQISVRTTFYNYCIATKSNGRYNVDESKLDSTLEQFSGKLEYLFMFSDVVSTGTSVYNVAKIIHNKPGFEKVKIISISVISDIAQERTVNMGEFFKVATFCSELRIPVIENIKLPSDAILSPKLDIS